MNDANQKTIIHLDNPVSCPRSIAYEVSGWVASDLEISSVFCGSHKLDFVDRPDVQKHFSDTAEIKYVYGFYGVANAMEINQEEIEISAKLENNEKTKLFKIETDNLLSISLKNNIENFNKLFPGVDAKDCINKSFDLKLSDAVEWEKKGLRQVCDVSDSSDDSKAINFLPSELKEKFSIIDNEIAARRGHDPLALALIGHYSDSLILDCGAGYPIQNYKNVVNFEIQQYNNTDVIGVGQNLPFKDNSFDVVFSHSVLEHVTDPFLCANEIKRVLKPNGILYASVPFLIPVHGYPDHYFNMTQNGLKSLFGDMEHLVCKVPNSGHPIYSISSALGIWHSSLESDDEKQKLMELSVKELIEQKDELVQASFSQNLKQKDQKMISCTNLLLARK